MLTTLKTSLWKQFGASIDTLEQAITLCPETMLQRKDRLFYITYHTLVFLDYFLTFPPPKPFTAPLPFTLTSMDDIPEQAIDDLLPDRLYTKQELLQYLQASREQCRQLIAGLTEEQVETMRFTEDYEDGLDYSVLEILLYNMRHVQHHAAQLNMMLRQQVNDALKWVREAKDGL